jgi:hypothetical protein
MPEVPTAYTFRTTHDAKQHIELREEERGRVKREIHALKRRFDETFPARPPGRLVLRQGGGICWRLRGSPGSQPVFDMTGEIGKALLQRLSLAARMKYLEFEDERSALDMRWSILNTEVRCLSNWVRRKRALMALKK